MANLRILRPFFGKIFRGKFSYLNIRPHHHVQELSLPALQQYSQYDRNHKASVKFPSILALSATLIAMDKEGADDVEEMEDEDVDRDGEKEMENVEDEPDENTNNFSFLEKDDLANFKIELIDGDKGSSKWLVINDIYICHRFQSNDVETFWECSGRRKYGCSFKAGTVVDDKGSLSLSYLYTLDSHDCDQSKMGPILQKFRNSIKQRCPLTTSLSSITYLTRKRKHLWTPTKTRRFLS